MGRQYSAKAVEDAFALFLRFKGGSWHRIDQEMARKGYVGFKAKSVFPDRGQGEKRRDGWINKYNWREALKLHLENLPNAALNDAQKLCREVKLVRTRLYEGISAKGPANADAQTLQLYRDFCKLSIEAITKVHEAQDTFSGFVSNWERLLDWITQEAPKTARELLKIEDLILKHAEEEFGETEEMAYRRPEDESEPPAIAGGQSE